MMTRGFGPWSTSLYIGAPASLNTFWCRRLGRLAEVRNARAIRPGGVSLLAALSLFILGAPLAQFELSANDSQPAREPHEQRIVIWRAGRLASMRPDGSEFAWLSDAKRGVAIDVPRLSPDGQRLAYGVRTFTDRPVSSEVPAQVHIRDLDDAQSLVDLGVSGHEWCWSGDGTKLLVATVEPPRDGQQDFKHVIVDVHTRQTSDIKLAAGHLATDWSTDGNWLLTTSVTGEPGSAADSAAQAQVDLITRDGTTVRRVSSPGQHAVFGRFSPDGQMVLYTVLNRENDTGSLYVVKLPGGEPRQITPGLNEEPMGASWSPDGERIAYVWRMRHRNGQAAHETESSLAIVDLEGNHLTTLLTEKALPREGVSNTQWIIRLHSPDWR